MNEQTGLTAQSAAPVSEADVAGLLNSVVPSDGVLTIGAAEVDLSRALPLTLGDMRKLERLGLTNEAGSLTVAGIEGVAQVLHLLIEKVNTSIKLADLDSLPVSKVTRAFLFIQKRIMEGEDVPNPTKPNS